MPRIPGSGYPEIDVLPMENIVFLDFFALGASGEPLGARGVVWGSLGIAWRTPGTLWGGHPTDRGTHQQLINKNVLYRKLPIIRLRRPHISSCSIPTVRTWNKKTISKKTMVSRLHFLRVVRESDAQSNQMSRHKMSPIFLAPQRYFL